MTASPSQPLETHGYEVVDGPSHEPYVRKKKHHPSIKVAALNITPFMDLTFNLLLFFVLTASFSIGEGVLPADVSVGRGPGGIKKPLTGPPKNPVTIHLTSYGSRLNTYGIYIENSQVKPKDFEELYQTLDHWRRDAKNAGGIYDSDNPMIIKPEPDVSWDYVVCAFNAVVRARFSNVAFQAPH